MSGMDESLLRGDLLNRCLQQIYEQILTGENEVGLQSIESLIHLNRCMFNPAGGEVVLRDEMRAIQEVFHIHHVNIEIQYPDLSATQGVRFGSLLYEICQHGIELIHSGCQLRGLILTRQDLQTAYTFTDITSETYGGMIYEEPYHPCFDGQT